MKTKIVDSSLHRWVRLSTIDSLRRVGLISDATARDMLMDELGIKKECQGDNEDQS